MMDIQKVWAVYFSATGTTDKAVNTIAEALAERLAVPLERVGFTKPAERAEDHHFTDSDLVVVGAPTYAGRLPNKILPDFQTRLHGNGALAVSVVTFGNRSYDNALAELCALLEANAFHTVAAGAFVCRHAFTDELAFGRPGWSDQLEMKDFAGRTADKIKDLSGIPAPVQIPGNANAPYYMPRDTDGEPVNFLKVKPKTYLAKCNNCGACARLCPMGAIDPANAANVPGICIKCQACVRKCTRRAKYFDDASFLSHVAMLERNFTEPGENETFL